MRIFAIESSARTASVAIAEDGKLISEIYTNTGLTHSQTLMYMAQAAFSCSQVELSSIDAFAVTNGPGSFTGIRIGISAVKGMAQAAKKNCIGISTLEAAAYNLLGQECLACAVMDARCGQVYTALFECRNKQLIRLTDDTAMPVSELKKNFEDNDMDLPVIFVGDGAEMCYNSISGNSFVTILASEHIRFQRASGVALAVFNRKSDKLFASADSLNPLYLRIPQAERELNKRNEELQDDIYRI